MLKFLILIVLSSSYAFAHSETYGEIDDVNFYDPGLAALESAVRAGGWENVIGHRQSRCPDERPSPRLPYTKPVPDRDPCRNVPGNSIVVLSSVRTLYVCQDSKALSAFDVALGYNGVGKTKQGDRKTPLGSYKLSRPRASSQFKTFLHVGYPTIEQKRKGYTGSDIGIHAPNRKFRCAGYYNVDINWTEGCISVVDDEAIEYIASWVNAQSRSIQVHILK